MVTVQEKKYCCGCAACVEVCPQKCIKYTFDEEGFGYPEVEAMKCVHCGLCESVCPVIAKEKNSVPVYEPIEGESKENFTHRVCESERNIPAFYVAYNRNSQIREKSTSGGTFSALAEYVYERGGWVYGVVLDQNCKIVHMASNSWEDLALFRESKYVQSEQQGMFENIKNKLRQNIMVLYSGTPCQVEGLKRYLGREYEKLITVDIFCHGVGSPKYWKKYVDYMQQKYNSPIQRVNFREKTYGYNSACMAVYFKNGKSSHKGHDDDLYWTAFSKCYIFRPSCYCCKFKTLNHVSDFSIGDFWETDELPESFQNSNGTTLIITHSEKAKTILMELSSLLAFTSVDPNEALLINGGHMPSKLISSSSLPAKRDDLFDDLDRMEIDAIVKKYMPLSFKQLFKCKLKPILYKLGMLEKVKRGKKPK